MSATARAPRAIAVPAGEGGGVPLRLEPGGGIGERIRHRQPAVGEQLGVAHHDRRRVDHADHAATGDGLRQHVGAQVDAPLLGPQRHRLADRVRAGRLDATHQPEKPMLVAVDHEARQGHRTPGQRPGLVEDHDVDVGGPLEDGGVLEQDPDLGAPPGPDHDGGRRGQPQGARAGDDQDGDGVADGSGVPAPATSQPTSTTTATAITTGTNTAETRSARSWIGALLAWASSTMRTICASIVFGPTPVTSISRAPSWLTVAP